MTTKVEVASTEPGYASFCDDCAEKNGYVVPLEFVPGILSVVQKTAVDIHAKVHEERNNHHVLIVDYKPIN